jgi:hypothetical protein
VVIVRRWRQQGPVRRPGAWTAVAVVDDLQLAAAIADLVSEEDVALDASVATADEVLHVFRGQDRERILDQLNGRTTKELLRELTLRRAAEGRLNRQERRSGVERRSGRERRFGIESVPPAGERRCGRDRRSRPDRRTMTAA